jgi:hypothetical protein
MRYFYGSKEVIKQNVHVILNLGLFIALFAEKRSEWRRIY